MDSFDPEAECCGDADSGEEVAGEFVVTCRNCAEVLEATECALDGVAELVGVTIEWEAVYAIDLVWDDGSRAARREAVPQGIAIIGAVGEKPGAGPAPCDEIGSGDDVGSLTGRQVEDVRPAFLVNEEMDLGCQSPRERPMAWRRSPLFALPRPSGAP